MHSNVVDFYGCIPSQEQERRHSWKGARGMRFHTQEPAPVAGCTFLVLAVGQNAQRWTLVTWDSSIFWKMAQRKTEAQWLFYFQRTQHGNDSVKAGKHIADMWDHQCYTDIAHCYMCLSLDQVISMLSFWNTRFKSHRENLHEILWYTVWNLHLYHCISS